MQDSAGLASIVLRFWQSIGLTVQMPVGLKQSMPRELTWTCSSMPSASKRSEAVGGPGASVTRSHAWSANTCGTPNFLHTGHHHGIASTSNIHGLANDG